MIDALRELLRDAAAEGARIALAERDAGERSTLIPIKSAPVSYRAILAAAKSGEITIHRRGKSSFVERAELERWIRDGARAAKKADAIDELIDMTSQRRRRRAG